MNLHPAYPMTRRSALVCLGAGSLACLRGVRGHGVSAQSATPAGSPDAADTAHLDLSIPAPVLPAAPIYLWSTMYQVQPGVSTDYPGFAIEVPVASAIWAQSGALTIEGELGPVQLASAPDASSTAGSVHLEPGDAVALELGPDRTYRLQSAGADPLIFTELWLVAGPRPSYPYPPDYQILDFYHDPDSVTLSSDATATMHLSRMPLDPGETLPVPEGSWQMVLTENPASISRSWPGGAPTNIGTAPVTIVSMTADFLDETGAPVDGTGSSN